MNQNRPAQLSWPFRFIIIAFSFFVFSLIIKIIGGSPGHTGIFMTIGYISTLLAVVGFTYNKLAHGEIKEKNDFSRS